MREDEIFLSMHTLGYVIVLLFYETFGVVLSNRVHKKIRVVSNISFTIARR